MKKLLILAATALMALVSCTKDGEGSVEGRWNGYAEDTPNDYVVSYILTGSKADIYILAWGEHYEGTWTKNNSNVTFTVTSGSRAEKHYEDGSKEYGMANGSIVNQETFELGDGFQWYELDAETFTTRKQEIAETFSLVLDSDTKGHGAVFGRQLVFSKAK